MARKINVDNAILRRLQYKNPKRRQDFLEKRIYYLIVCEGQKTEPNYFEGLKQTLPQGVLTTCQINIQGLGNNTISLVRQAKNIKSRIEEESGREVDKLWVVFDKDSFSADSFNNAINSCQTSRPKIHCAWSNEAFELWYLLHFHNFNTALSREDYTGLIEKNLKPHLGADFKYKKNSVEMFHFLTRYGDIHQAIKWAKELARQYEGQGNFADHNPCTMVFQLVEELISMSNPGL